MIISRCECLVGQLGGRCRWLNRHLYRCESVNFSISARKTVIIAVVIDIHLLGHLSKSIVIVDVEIVAAGHLYIAEVIIARRAAYKKAIYIGPSAAVVNRVAGRSGAHKAPQIIVVGRGCRGGIYIIPTRMIRVHIMSAGLDLIPFCSRGRWVGRGLKRQRLCHQR